jgi:hypothetical protein
MLTQLAIQNAKPREKSYKRSDGFGLHLLVTTTGAKLWRYRFARRENMLGFGPFPEVGILDAREQRDAARKLLRQGIDPGAHRKQEKLQGRRRLTTPSVRSPKSTWTSFDRRDAAQPPWPRTNGSCSG